MHPLFDLLADAGTLIDEVLQITLDQPRPQDVDYELCTRLQAVLDRITNVIIEMNEAAWDEHEKRMSQWTL